MIQKWAEYKGKADPSRPWYVGYIDSTHLHVTPNIQKPGIGLHIAQVTEYMDAEIITARFNSLRALHASVGQ